MLALESPGLFKEMFGGHRKKFGRVGGAVMIKKTGVIHGSMFFELFEFLAHDLSPKV